MKLVNLQEARYASSFKQTARWLSREDWEQLSPGLQSFTQQYKELLNDVYNELLDRLEQKIDASQGWGVEGWQTHEEAADTYSYQELEKIVDSRQMEPHKYMEPLLDLMNNELT